MVAMWARWRAMIAPNSLALPQVGVGAVALRVASSSVSSAIATMSTPIFVVQASAKS